MQAHLPALLAYLLASQVGSVFSATKGPFVTTSPSGRFLFNNTEFPLVGTTAYWLPSLSDAQDIDYTLGNISEAGFNALRVWAFNDVDTIPENGTWFQHIDKNGTVTINNGTDGLQKLDSVVSLAEKHKIFLLLSLTNNWNPIPPNEYPTDQMNFTKRDGSNDSTTVQRNALSNQYGGMDLYVRQLTDSQEHDQFYANQSLVNVYKNYVAQVVSRYKDSPYVLSWEVANDPRCNSTVSASAKCTTLTVTSWHADVAQHISQFDPNHLISSGASGFLCADCPKLYQKTAPAPQPSPVARRGIPKPLTRKSLLQEKKAILKKKRAAEIARGVPAEGRTRIRGRWLATPTKRQSEENGVGSAFNGATGVDSEDILSIPHIGFGSFQLFPDQFSYGLVEPGGPLNASENLAVGLDWITRQAQAAARVGKPILLTGFGLLTQNNSQSFVPFNSTVAPFGPAPGGTQGSQQQQPAGVTAQQGDSTFTQWTNATLNSGSLAGAIHHQWFQGGLKIKPGVPTQTQATNNNPNPNQQQVGNSPNDGYAGRPSIAKLLKGWVHNL